MSWSVIFAGIGGMCFGLAFAYGFEVVTVGRDGLARLLVLYGAVAILCAAVV